LSAPEMELPTLWLLESPRKRVMVCRLPQRLED
jgi:hypothetical protein